ncbi:MAG: PEP-CTERM sorting domain-containing protein [bacterium]|jgi:hypothetical protein
MRLTLVFAAVLSLLLTTAYARVIHEDNIYWMLCEGKDDISFVATNGDGEVDQFVFEMLMNPTQAQLEENAGRLVIKIEETVYDKSESLAMLNREGIQNAPSGFLYTYTVANLNLHYLDNNSTEVPLDINSFHAYWGVPSLGTYVVRPNVPPQIGWNPTNPSPPAWEAVGFNYMVPRGSSVGGLWAVSNSDNDVVIPADIDVIINGKKVLVHGWTTGPVPEPSSISALLIGGTFIAGILRRKRR